MKRVPAAKLMKAAPRCGVGVGLAVAVGILLCAAVSLGQPTASGSEGGDAPQIAVSKEGLEARLRSVDILIEQSTVARRVEASGNPEALKQRRLAREAYKRALEARDTEDYAAAARLISEASTHMFEAARLATKVREPEGRQADFSGRVETVKALVAALRRISAEKPNVAGAAETAQNVEQLMSEARRLRDAGRQAEAEAALNKAYLLVRAAVSSMRSGDTLVRSLNFATPQEEYHYELDRNNVHLMLIKVVAAEKNKLGSRMGSQRGGMDRAMELRKQAEEAFGEGDADVAIRRLEESTRELQRMIRNFGVFIPG